MRNVEYDFKALQDLLSSIDYYKYLENSLPQLDRTNKQLQDLYNQYYKNDNWLDFQVIQLVQNWSNTSCGWESLGGSALSSDYTTIIYNRRLKIICVFYSGKLAYIAKDNEKLEVFKKDSYYLLPGYNSCSNKLDVIYKAKR